MIPLRDGKDCDKPGWIVDGQQRSAAIRNAQVSAFPMCVVGFVAETDAEQREQFILVNSTKPCQSYDQTPFSIGTGIDYLVSFLMHDKVISVAISSRGALKIVKGITRN